MDLKTAVNLVIADTRQESGDLDMLAQDAVASARTITMEDVHGSVSPGDDPQLIPAYEGFLAASDDEIAAILAE